MTVQNFWRQQQNVDNRRVIVRDYGVISNQWYLYPDGGGPRGSFTTFEELAPNLRDRDTIFLAGVLREQAVAPEVYDIAIIGVGGFPRQATDGGVPTGGGATWMAPATGAVATTPLLQIVRQGWTIENVAFNPYTASAAIRLTTSGGLNEAGQCTIRGCAFMGGGTTQIGIEDNGGSGFVLIEDNLFQGLSDTAIKGLTTANAVPLAWIIRNNQFRSNTNDIKMSLSYALIRGNNHFTAGSGSTNKVVSTVALSGQGGFNQVCLNYFNNTTGEIQISNGYSGASSDLWSNYCKGTAALIVTSPPGA